MNEDGIGELADSIGKVGLLQPIIVRPLGDGYQIIAGERRWRAARVAGLERVPVRVLTTSEVEALEIALIENLQREDLNAIEEARGYRRLLAEHQMTQAELADKVSKSRSAITNALRLLDLPDEVVDLVYSGKLSAGHARAILGVPEEVARTRLAAKVVEDGLSVRETENLARLYAAGQAERAPRPTTPKSFKLVARKLRRMLGTNVRVRVTEKKGKIEIDFHGEEDLERIYRLLAENAEASPGEEGSQ
jgi:ParB family chromosome partitioning protein